MELLRVLLKARVEHEGVAKKLVASSEDLEDLARAARRTGPCSGGGAGSCSERTPSACFGANWR